MYKRLQLRTLAQLDPALAASSSGSLSRSSLSTLPSEDWRNPEESFLCGRQNPDTIDGGYLDFGEASGTDRR